MADLLSQAGANARPFPRYLAFMAMAGIIAALGVIYENVTLVVGAMAISPCALPITAAATALILHGGRLAARAVVALGAGLGTACLLEAVMTFMLNQLDLLPSGFVVGQGGFLAGLSTVTSQRPSLPLPPAWPECSPSRPGQVPPSELRSPSQPFRRPPTSAWLQASAKASKAGGALLVLANVTILLIGGCLTLVTQRSLARHAERGLRAVPGDGAGR